MLPSLSPFEEAFLVSLQDGGAVVGPIFPKPLAQLLAAAMAARARPAAHRLKSHCLGAAAAALVEGHLRDGHQLLLWSAAWAEVLPTLHLCVCACNVVSGVLLGEFGLLALQ